MCYFNSTKLLYAISQVDISGLVKDQQSINHSPY